MVGGSAFNNSRNGGKIEKGQQRNTFNDVSKVFIETKQGRILNRSGELVKLKFIKDHRRLFTCISAQTFKNL